MALLDLQDMESDDMIASPGGKSASSKGCGNTSGLSLLLC